MSGLLGKAINVTRCNIAVPLEGPDFEAARFFEIESASEVRERIGIVPFEIGAAYEIGARRYAFRVRIDQRKPDAVAVRERVRELIKAEIETGAPFVSGKRRKVFKALAEAELLVGLRPKSAYVECVIDGDVLYVGSAAKAQLGAVLTALRRTGTLAELKAPWLEADAPVGLDEDIRNRDTEGARAVGAWMSVPAGSALGGRRRADRARDRERTARSTRPS